MDGNECVYTDNYRGSGLELRSDGSSLSYINNNGEYATVGELYQINNMSNLCVLIYNDDGDGSYSWSSENGLVLSAPVLSKNQAMEMTQKLVFKDAKVKNVDWMK